MTDVNKLEGLGYEAWMLKKDRDAYIEWVTQMSHLKTISEEWLAARRRLVRGQATEADFERWGKFKKGVSA